MVTTTGTFPPSAASILPVTKASGSRCSAASSAYDSFEGTVGDIPTDVSVSEAAGQYTDASDAFVTELAAIASEAGCS